MTDDGARAAVLRASLAALSDRIDAACAAAGRDRAEVTLLAVTKTFPATDVALLADLGLTRFGENRAQEAAPKVTELARLRPDVPAQWSMVGRLQRNKARAVARWAAEVQSVDSPRLASALATATANAREAGERTTPLDVLLQVTLDDDPSRGGCPPDGLADLAAHVAAADDLRLRGVMAVAPLPADPRTADPSAADPRAADPRAAFDTLAVLADRLRAEHPGATVVSAGMSGDLESAIARGSTCVRVGTALLGGRELASPAGSAETGR